MLTTFVACHAHANKTGASSSIDACCANLGLSNIGHDSLDDLGNVQHCSIVQGFMAIIIRKMVFPIMLLYFFI